jgi:hypothetical protein
MKTVRRSQLDVHVLGTGQESQKKISPPSNGKIVGAAFGRVPRGHNEGRRQERDALFQLRFMTQQRIQAQFKKIGRLPHVQGMLQISPGRDNADDSATMRGPDFDRILGCHILITPDGGEAMTTKASL